MGLLEVILPALLPPLLDGLKSLGSSLFGKIFGSSGAQPRTVDEAIRLQEAETNRLAALAELDRPAGKISRWVANWRAINRYVLGDLILAVTVIGTVGYVFVPDLQTAQAQAILETLWRLSGSVFSFFFGDRVYIHLKNGKRK